jgi:hypothetical protein
MRWQTKCYLHERAETYLRNDQDIEAAWIRFEGEATARYDDGEGHASYALESRDIFEFEKNLFARRRGYLKDRDPLKFLLIALSWALEDYPKFAAHWDRWSKKLLLLFPDGRWDLSTDDLRRLWEKLANRHE